MDSLSEKTSGVTSRSFVLPHLDLLLDAILQNFIDGAILVLERTGSIVWMSEQAPGVLHTSRAALLHRPFFEAVALLQLDKSSLPPNAHPVYRVINDHSYKQIQPFFCLYQRRDNDQQTPFVLRTARVATSNGHPISYVVQLREAQRQLDLKEMNRSFVSLAAHQLKTPAGVIQGFLEMALQKPASLHDMTQLHKYLLAAYEANRSLIRTAKDLLSATKIT